MTIIKFNLPGFAGDYHVTPRSGEVKLYGMHNSATGRAVVFDFRAYPSDGAQIPTYMSLSREGAENLIKALQEALDYRSPKPKPTPQVGEVWADGVGMLHRILATDRKHNRYTTVALDLDKGDIFYYTENGVFDVHSASSYDLVKRVS